MLHQNCSVDGAATRGGALVRLRGEIDLASLDDIGSMVAALLPEDGREATIDLSGITFIDCGGLRIVQRIRELAAARSIRCTFVDPSPAVRRVLDLVGLEGLLEQADEP